MQVDWRVALGVFLVILVGAIYIYHSSFRIEGKLNRILTAVGGDAAAKDSAPKKKAPTGGDD